MKESKLSFAEGFLGNEARAAKGSPHKVFDWNKAANFIKQYLPDHPDLIAEAGLEGDWNYTGGEIFRDGKPTNECYTYLASNWAIPTLILSWDGDERIGLECFSLESEVRFNENSKWDEQSLSILGIPL